MSASCKGCCFRKSDSACDRMYFSFSVLISLPVRTKTERLAVRGSPRHSASNSKPLILGRTRSLPTRPSRLHGLIAMNDSLEFVQDRTVPPAALYFLPHNGKGLLRRQSFFVRALGSERVINIHDLKDTRC